MSRLDGRFLKVDRDAAASRDRIEACDHGPYLSLNDRFNSLSEHFLA